MNASESDLRFAHRLADVAEAIGSKHFAIGHTAWRSKDDGTPVTGADEQIERALRTLILHE